MPFLRGCFAMRPGHDARSAGSGFRTAEFIEKSGPRQWLRTAGRFDQELRRRQLWARSCSAGENARREHIPRMLGMGALLAHKVPLSRRARPVPVGSAYELWRVAARGRTMVKLTRFLFVCAV